MMVIKGWTTNDRFRAIETKRHASSGSGQSQSELIIRSSIPIALCKAAGPSRQIECWGSPGWHKVNLPMWEYLGIRFVTSGRASSDLYASFKRILNNGCIA